MLNLIKGNANSAAKLSQVVLQEDTMKGHTGKTSLNVKFKHAHT
jgi:hypothetical protein